MAVESRFVVIRQGVEVETFMDKKSADEYDKMLDMADNLTAMFENASLELTEQLTEDLSIFLAQNRDDVLVALQAKKAKVEKKPAVKVAVDAQASKPEEVEEPVAAVETAKADGDSKATSAPKAATKAATKKAPVKRTKKASASDQEVA